MTKQELNNLTFKELHDKFYEVFDLDHLFKISVSTEVKNSFSCRGLKLTEDEFEVVCEYVYDWILDADITAEALTENIATRIANKEFTVKDLENRELRAQEIIEMNL